MSEIEIERDNFIEGLDFSSDNIIGNLEYKKSKSKSFNDLKKDLEIKSLIDTIDRDKKDHELKLIIAYFLLGLLSIQMLFIFLIIVLQGSCFQFWYFDLDEYIFYILISGTLVESYFLVRIVVEHLFPKNDKQ